MATLKKQLINKRNLASIFTTATLFAIVLHSRRGTAAAFEPCNFFFQALDFLRSLINSNLNSLTETNSKKIKRQKKKKLKFTHQKKNSSTSSACAPNYFKISIRNDNLRTLLSTCFCALLVIFLTRSAYCSDEIVSSVL